MSARTRVAAFGLLAALLSASPALAAIELDPGLWQDIETGTENGQPAKPEVTSDCMSPEEAKDPIKSLSATAVKDTGGQCKKYEVKQNGNTVSVDMNCGDPQIMSIEMIGTYTFIDRRHYTGKMKSTVTIAGQKTASDKSVDSKWIGPCKDKPGTKK
jgi:hypothetical protein